MHYHCEIVMPPTPANSVGGQIESIMAPFDENCDRETPSGHSFWDYWVIGGRWSGEKAKTRIGKDRINDFCAELKRREVTVSGLQWGKQELKPASQIAEVDALWREWFPIPSAGIESCPLFKHAGEILSGDICEIADAPMEMSCSRVIVAGPGWSSPDQFSAEYMVEDSIWNGVVHQATTWDGTLGQAIDRHHEKLKNYTAEAREKYTVEPNWTVVTIDYHS